MSQQNAAAIADLGRALDKHAVDEAEVWGAVRSQVSDIHDAMFGSEKDPDRKGFNEQLRDMQDDINGAKRFGWLGLGAMITALVALVKSALVGN